MTVIKPARYGAFDSSPARFADTEAFVLIDGAWKIRSPMLVDYSAIAQAQIDSCPRRHGQQ
jgi:hypothetical protein